MARRSLVLLTAIVIAAVGVALIFVYVNRAQERATEGQELITVRITQTTVAAGATLAEAVGKTDEARVSANSVPRDQVVIPSALTADSADLVAKAAIPAGTPLRLDSFGRPGGGTVQGATEITGEALALQLGDPQRIASYLKPGIEVRIYQYDRDAKAATATPLIDRIKVLKVGSTPQPGISPDPQLATGLAPTLVTVDAQDKQAAQLIAAQLSNKNLYMTALAK